MAEGRERSSLETDPMFRYALIYLIGVIGEAARRVSVLTRRMFPQIPWAGIMGMRNRLVHGYDRIDLSLLWDTVMVDLPPLIAALESIVGES